MEVLKTDYTVGGGANRVEHGELVIDPGLISTRRFNFRDRGLAIQHVCVEPDFFTYFEPRKRSRMNAECHRHRRHSEVWQVSVLENDFVLAMSIFFTSPLTNGIDAPEEVGFVGMAIEPGIAACAWTAVNAMSAKPISAVGNFMGFFPKVRVASSFFEESLAVAGLNGPGAYSRL